MRSATKTFSHIMQQGRTNGFDYLRVVLAVLVILTHVPLTTYGKASPIYLALGDGYLRPAAAAVLPIFFSLSGFLVAGSLVRTSNIFEFVTLRLIRLVPALFVEVLLSAVILGSLLTELPIRDYVTNPEFRVYFLNVVGNIHMVLPGVFLHNPFPRIVNGQLWTIPIELQCYIVITAMALLRIHKNRWIFLAVTIAYAFYRMHKTILGLGHIFDRSIGVEHELVLYFLGGILVYLFADRIPRRAGFFLFCIVATYAALYFKTLSFFAWAPIGYLTVYAGLSNFRQTFLIKGGDYSYGLYLYGFAIQQTVALMLRTSRTWWITFPLALALACGFALFSWHAVEKRVMGQRKWLIGRVDALTNPMRALRVFHFS